uniref:RING-type domain-containing protein n=1 Tax=Aureoumbra lagunensis TaxID=44058 RepID=A0A7S3JSG6_9STRA|mmetsp:Transcript_4231/g.5963  ORF Transcript_4231/g.5963 Transcript_4231/m.5963 type:complete len:335 (+) Transcript_4231:98-1102(+)
MDFPPNNQDHWGYERYSSLEAPDDEELREASSWVEFEDDFAGTGGSGKKIVQRNMIGGLSEGDTEEEIIGTGTTSTGKVRGRSRRELPAHAVAILKAWLVSPEHFHHPYPTAQDQAELMAQTGIDKKQLKNWFTNARRRIWKPLVKHKLMQGDTSIDPNILENVASQTHRPKATKSASSIASGTSIGGSGDSSSATPARKRSHQQNHFHSNEAQSDNSFLDLLVTAVDEPSQAPIANAPQSFNTMPQQSTTPSSRQATTDTHAITTAVRVPKETKCEFCLRERVDTQLMPCTHRFHGHCLRPWLEATVTTPSCPVCAVSISNCVFADPSGVVTL